MSSTLLSPPLVVDAQDLTFRPLPGSTQRSGCASCHIRDGCMGAQHHRSYAAAAILNSSESRLASGSVFQLSVDRLGLLRCSLLVFCAPLMGLLGLAWVGPELATHSLVVGPLSLNPVAVIGAVALIVGIGFGRRQLVRQWFARQLQPQLVPSVVPQPHD